MLTGPREYSVQDVTPPRPEPGQVVVDVERAGICGTDVEFFTGDMQYLRDGFAAYPLRLGHEWCGRVSEVAAGVHTDWIGKRVTGDTMLGCGECARCRDGRAHLCEGRFEIGIRGGFPGALAEQLAVPVGALHTLPASIDPAQGALVEPGGNALRAVLATKLAPGDRLLIIGPGTIGLLAAQMAAARGALVTLLARSTRSTDAARSLGFDDVWTLDHLPPGPYDAVIDASNAAGSPELAVELVEPGGRVAFVGLAGSPSMLDTHSLVLKDVTAVGVLSASPALERTIELYASGTVDPGRLVAVTVGLDGVGSALAGIRPDGAGIGPKVQVDPLA